MAEGRLQGRVCVVTGASGGIGAATVELFEREGAHVVGVDLAEGAPGELSLQVDVTDEAQVREMYARVRERYGRIDVLFNNAGISPTDDASVLDTTLEAWERVQDVNLRSVFLCCKHGIPHLLDSGGGSVINTASFVAVMGAATSQISYTASKGGVLALSRELGVEFARRACASTRSAQGPSTRRCCGSSTRRIPSRPSAGWCTCRWGASRAPRRSPRGAVPRQRRVELRDRLHVPGRRRAQRRLHDAAIGGRRRSFHRQRGFHAFRLVARK